MGEKNLDFDTVIERRNTKSLKYDFAKRRGMPEDVLPFWVADMDFKISSYIIEAKEYGLDDQEVNRRIIHKAKLWLDAGSIFGTTGEGFQRINIACPRSLLTEALDRIVDAFQDVE